MAAVEHITVVLPAEFPRGGKPGASLTVEVPLARVAGRVTSAAEDFGIGDQIVAQRQIVLDCPRVLRVAAGHQRGTRGRAHRRCGVETVGDRAVRRDPIEMRSFNFDARPPNKSLIVR